VDIVQASQGQPWIRLLVGAGAPEGLFAIVGLVLAGTAFAPPE
jgi:hypothetical protein